MSGYNHLIDEAEETLGLLADQVGPDSIQVMKLQALLELLRPKTGRIEVMSIFGHKTRKPFVELHVSDVIVTQWTPEDARGHALQVLEAAEAAEQDAFFFEYITKRVGSNELAAAGLLQEYRAFRAAQREQS